jgi:UDP-2,4-diacetamido-2,4,6-trideoxy-beta-L-altropyranose hydrolase
MGALTVFRCDASPSIGAGHVMRCLATAETLVAAGWSVAFRSSAASPLAAPALAASAYPIVTKEQTLDANVLVFDHYGIDRDEETRSRTGNQTIVAYDDKPVRDHDADILVDPTPERAPAEYQARLPRNATVLAGAAYAQLREKWRVARRPSLMRRKGIDRARRVLVSMGATDPYNATSKVLAGLRASRLDVDVDVVLGPAAPHRWRVVTDLGVRQCLHVDPSNFADLAVEADFAVGAAGSSSFERACIGLPSLVVQTADNQIDLIKAFERAGAAVAASISDLDRVEEFAARLNTLAEDVERLNRMSENCAALVDGRGPQRLLITLAGEVTARGGQRVRLRVAEGGDEDYLLELQRQPATRRFARNTASPTEQEHAVWFARTLSDRHRHLLVVEADGRAVGMLRLDRQISEKTLFEVSVAIDQDAHGCGFGSAALALTRRAVPGADLLATVSDENAASLALFRSAGYLADGSERYRSRA